MSSITLLIFAYHFPPENAIGGERPFRFYKYLSRMGYRCHVITAARQNERNPDIECIPDPFLDGPGGSGWQVERFIRKFFLPGVVGLRWSRLAARAGAAIAQANRGRPVAVLSTFPPLGTHLAGWTLARRGKLPWIADFRDPLGDNPGHGANRFQGWIYNRMERIALNSADLAIANTDAAAEQLRKSYPEQTRRIQLIWNGFDPEDRIGPLPLPPRPHKLISHVGALYEGRTITPLLESIARLIDGGRLRPDAICINLIGSAREGSIPPPEFIDRARSAGWLQVDGKFVPKAEARRISQTSDGLLLAQPHSLIQVPGKIFEYIQIGRPVLAFIPTNTPIERILKQSGVPYRCAYADLSPERMDDAILEYVRILGEAGLPNTWFEEQFDGRRQVETLDRYIRSVLKLPE